jgi:hypothetical protein
MDEIGPRAVAKGEFIKFLYETSFRLKVTMLINKRVLGSQRSPRIVDLAPIRMANRQKVKPSDIVT